MSPSLLLLLSLFVSSSLSSLISEDINGTCSLSCECGSTTGDCTCMPSVEIAGLRTGSLQGCCVLNETETDRSKMCLAVPPGTAGALCICFSDMYCATCVDESIVDSHCTACDDGMMLDPEFGVCCDAPTPSPTPRPTPPPTPVPTFDPSAPQCASFECECTGGKCDKEDPNCYPKPLPDGTEGTGVCYQYWKEGEKATCAAELPDKIPADMTVNRCWQCNYDTGYHHGCGVVHGDTLLAYEFHTEGRESHVLGKVSHADMSPCSKCHDLGGCDTCSYPGAIHDPRHGGVCCGGKADDPGSNPTSSHPFWSIPVIVAVSIAGSCFLVVLAYLAYKWIQRGRSGYEKL